MQGTRVRSLVRELRSHMLFGTAKNIYRERERRKDGRQGNIITKKERNIAQDASSPQGAATVLWLQSECMHAQLSPTLHVCAFVLSHVLLFVTPWTAAHKAPLSMGFFRQEYWSGLPFPFPGDLPKLGLEITSPALAGRFFYH